MIDLAKVRNYYIACGYTDLRLGIDGLAAVVTQQYGRHLDEESRSCSAAGGPTESRHCTGAVTDISCCISGYPTEDFNGQGRKRNCGYWIHKAFGGSWKDFVLSRKPLSAKENRKIYSNRKVYVSSLNSIFSCTLSCLYAIIKAG